MMVLPLGNSKQIQFKVSWHPKIDHFQIDIIQTSPLQKVSEKDCFYAKLLTKKG